MSTSSFRLPLILAGLMAVAACAPAQTVVPATKEQEQKLLAILKSDASRKDKHDACRLLSIIATKEAVPTLAALLADEELSHMARYALEPIPDPAVDNALLEALGKLQGRPLVGVIGSLGVRGEARAIPPLANMLNNADPDVAQAAGRALGSIGGPPAAQALQKALANAPAANQLAICEGLFRCAEAMAAQGQKNQAIAIYDALRQRDEPRQIRAGALRGALLARGPDGVALLAECLGNDDYVLFSAAVQTAQEMPGAKVTTTLTSQLGQGSIDRQILILQTLGQRDDASALPAVVQAAQRGDTAVRVEALNVLGGLGDASVVSTLFAAAVDPESEVAKAARTTLTGLASDQAVDAAILAMIEKGKTDARLIAIDVVAQRRAANANQVLLKTAEDADKQIRLAALDALSQTGESKVLPNLVSLLVARNNADELRAAENTVQTVCGKSADKDAAAKILLAALPNASVDAQCALLRLLRVTGGSDALQTVRSAAKNSNAQVQEAAVRTLCEWPSAEAAPDLIAMAKSSDNTSRQIAALRGYISLIRDDSLSTEKKLAMADQAASLIKRDEEKKLLLGVLGGVPSSESLSMVLAHMDNPATKNEASQAAVAIAEKIVDSHAKQVAEAMQKVVDATDNRGLQRRARQILNDARKKAGQ